MIYRWVKNSDAPDDAERSTDAPARDALEIDVCLTSTVSNAEHVDPDLMHLSVLLFAELLGLARSDFGELAPHGKGINSRPF